MVNLSGLFEKAKQLVKENPDSIRGGLDRVESVINDKTKGKYADKLAKGRGGLDSALGVPEATKEAYRDSGGSAPPAERIDKPAPIDKPGPIE